jgi:predicted O-methyltransferase YrrM
MSLAIIFVVATFVGLTAAFTAVALGWQEVNGAPQEGRSGRLLGSACLFASGVALAAIVQWKIMHIYTYVAMGVEFLSRDEAPRVCLLWGVLLLVTLVIFWRRTSDTAKGTNLKGVLLGSMALALIVAFAEANVFQYVRNSWDDNYIPQLPRPVVVHPKDGVPEKYQHTYRFRPGTEGYFGAKAQVWEKVLADYKGKANISYLEVGLFEGRSFVWAIENIFTDPTSRLTGIDPFFETYEFAPSAEQYKDVFFANLEASGARDRSSIIKGFSQVELRKLPLNSFDVIYIDGSHEKRDVLEDAILAWRLLKDGGVLIFDDYLIFGSKAAIDIFYSCFSDQFDIVHVDEQVVLKKRPEKKP